MASRVPTNQARCKFARAVRMDFFVYRCAIAAQACLDHAVWLRLALVSRIHGRACGPSTGISTTSSCSIATVSLLICVSRLRGRARRPSRHPDPMQLRTLIVDDEPVARHRLKRLLLKDADVTVVAECADGDSAVTAIREHAPDLVFLDVQMPRTNGFDVVRAIGVERMPAIIFVTAFDRFALQAFEAQALDYLVKPFGEERVRKALGRARTFLKGGAEKDLRGRLAGLLNATFNPKANCLLVKERDRTLVLRPHEIDWVEADADYVRLHVGHESHMIRSTLTGMEERLAMEGFVRIHRSRLVNLDRVKELRPLFQGESVVVLKSGARLNARHGSLQELQNRIGT